MKYNMRKHKIRSLALLLLMPLIILGCSFVINNIDILNEDGEEVTYIKAGEVVTFKFDGKISIDGDASAERFIVSFLVPRSWNARKNTTVTYREDKYEPGVDHIMTIIPESEQPAGKGMSWDAALKKKYGVGSNVLNDMEWVTFQSDSYAQVSGEINYVVTIKCKTGTNNLRFKPSFFINHSTDGLGDKSEKYAKKDSEDCFEVVEGQGGVIDFCFVHYYQINPLSALQDDFVTFSFQGDVFPENDLIKADKVYLEATAYTEEGNQYIVNEKSAKTLMKREEKLSRYNVTMWPAGFFNIPEGETITRIEYVFTNEDGTVKITKSDDDRDNSGEEVEDGAQEPFSFELLCN